MSGCKKCNDIYKKPCEQLNYLDTANNCTDLKKFVDEIRAEVIEEITQKVEFEEKWLFDCYKENGCKYSSKDIDIAFNGIKHHLRKLKEQK